MLCLICSLSPYPRSLTQLQCGFWGSVITEEKADFILAGGEASLFLTLLRQQRLNKNFFCFVSVFIFESSLKTLKIPYHNYKSGMQLLLQHNDCMEGYGVMHASEGGRTSTYCNLYSVPGLYICPRCCKAASEAVTGNLGVVSMLVNVGIVVHGLVQLFSPRMAMATSVQQNYAMLWQT